MGALTLRGLKYLYSVLILRGSTPAWLFLPLLPNNSKYFIKTFYSLWFGFIMIINLRDFLA